MQPISDSQEIRPGVALNWPRLEEWLRARLTFNPIAGLDLRHRMHVEQFPGGHSNLTYLLRFGAFQLVLRRPPLGPVPPVAHDMAREYRWLTAISPTFPLAPRAYDLCDDLDVVGCVFYLMEHRQGVVIRDKEPERVEGNAFLRRRIGFALIDTLALLHRIDIQASRLEHLGKPVGFVDRQVRGWTDRWQRFKTGENVDIEAVAAWLHDSLPTSTDPPGIVHGDFKLDNVLLDARSLDRVVAVFDWEMSALGEPLVDLGMLLAYWVPSAPPGHNDALTPVTDLPGWPTRNELIERYARQSGRDLAHLTYFEVFAYFKIAVVIQQLYYRFVHRHTDDQRFAVLGDRVTYLARAAIERLEKS